MTLKSRQIVPNIQTERKSKTMIQMTVTSGNYREATGVALCTNHTGKMRGLWSMSTSPLCNALCKCRAKAEGSICQKCYSMEMQNQYSDLARVLQRNTEILTSQILEITPVIGCKSGLFRFESFGDLNNTIQVVNYFRVARENGGAKCCLFTKNAHIIREAVEEFDLVKPKNLQIIGSSYQINEPMTEYYRQFDFIDRVFTVYDKEYVAKHGIEITCGARSCRGCRKCYEGTHESYEIRELLK